MDYPELLSLLADLEKKGSRYSLENTRILLSELLRGRERPITIQIAGTNGKGSTAFFLEHMLRAAHYTVGTFTSPHLCDVRERIRLNGRWISETEMISRHAAVQHHVSRLQAEGVLSGPPTYFELTFLMAYDFFLASRVQFAILEVGLGGRLDATTAAQTDVAVITGVSLDHTELLGNTTEQIAAEKAGIAKKGVPLVSGCEAESPAHRVITQAAEQAGAPAVTVFDSENRLETTPLVPAGYACRYQTPLRDYTCHVAMNGRHQPRNAAIAIKTLEQLDRLGIHVSPSAIAAGAAACRVPGRLEYFPGPPPTLLDCSHNPEGVAALADYLRESGVNEFHLIFGALADKDYREMVRLLAPLAKRATLTRPQSPRALPPETLAPIFREYGAADLFIEPDPIRAFALARQEGMNIVVAGSFYLAGILRPVITIGG